MARHNGEQQATCTPQHKRENRPTLAKVFAVHLRSPLQTLGIQDDTLLVVGKHVAHCEALQKAVIIAAVPLADLAMHLQQQLAVNQ